MSVETVKAVQMYQAILHIAVAHILLCKFNYGYHNQAKGTLFSCMFGHGQWEKYDLPRDTKTPNVWRKVEKIGLGSCKHITSLNDEFDFLLFANQCPETLYSLPVILCDILSLPQAHFSDRSKLRQCFLPWKVGSNEEYNCHLPFEGKFNHSYSLVFILVKVAYHSVGKLCIWDWLCSLTVHLVLLCCSRRFY